MSDEQLEAALRRAFQDAVSDIEPSHELRRRVDEMGANRRLSRADGWRPLRLSAWSRLRRRIIAGTVGGLAAAGAAVAVLVSLTTAPPAFAVVVRPNGSIQITLYDLEQMGNLNARLRQLRLPVVVVPMTASCTVQVALTYIGTTMHPAPQAVLQQTPAPSGWTDFMAAKQVGPNLVQTAVGQIKGPAPSCVPIGRYGPGVRPYESIPGKPDEGPVPTRATTGSAQPSTGAGE